MYKKTITEGLDGLEVWHRGNPSEQRERLLTIARRHDLLVTGGSDWHGKGKPNALGENLTDDETVQEIINRGVRLSKESSKEKIKTDTQSSMRNCDMKPGTS